MIPGEMGSSYLPVSSDAPPHMLLQAREGWQVGPAYV